MPNPFAHESGCLPPALRTPYFLVFEGSSSVQVALPSEGEMVIGCSADAGVRLRDRAAVARHARLAAARGETTLFALDGRTSVNGERLQSSRVLTSGDVLTIGDATLVFHRDPGRSSGHAVLSPREMRMRLAEETERALRYQRPLAVLVIDAGDTQGMDPGRLLEAVAGAVRLVDVVGFDGVCEFVVLLPETAETAAIPSQRLLRALLPLAPRARAGFARCPSDGVDADTLLTGSRAASRAAGAGTVAAVADATTSVKLSDGCLVAADPMMKRLLSLVEHLAATDSPVLIRGEAGVGKRTVARALHAWSQRKDGPFAVVACSEVTDTELMGQQLGGGRQSTPGILERASAGTVFLDEVGILSALAQDGLFELMQSRRVVRSGATSSGVADVRIVASTSGALDERVAEGKFRKDLLHHLSATTVVVPPLRDRALDLSALARSFLQEACSKHGQSVITLSSEALQRLALHPWPGNARELRSVIDYLVSVVQGGVAEAEHLPERIGSTVPWLAPKPVRKGTPRPDAAAGGSPLRNLYAEIRDLERARIEQALTEAGGVKTRAAALIGMPLRTLVTKMKAYGLG